MTPDPIVDRLVEDLEPVSRPPSTLASIALWGLASWALVALLIGTTGSLRPDALTQLGSVPRYLFECGLGVGVGMVAIAAALRLATPGAGRPLRVAAPVLLLIAAWVAAYVYGLWQPALEATMAGKRPRCFVETLLFSLPPLALGLVLLRRRAALEPARAAALAAVAAASLPAVAMQVACMYDPSHALRLHLTPLLVLGAAGALLGRLLLRKI